MDDMQRPDLGWASFHRLIRKWIPAGQAVERQVDGFERLASAVTRTLDPIIGGMATRATLSRAASLAARRYPRLGSLVGPGNSLNVAQLREELKSESPARARRLLVALAGEWFGVLHWLLGSTLLPLLQEAEEELEATGPPSSEAKEGP